MLDDILFSVGDIQNILLEVPEAVYVGSAQDILLATETQTQRVPEEQYIVETPPRRMQVGRGIITGGG